MFVEICRFVECSELNYNLNMDRKRPFDQNETEEGEVFSDSESDGIYGDANDSSDYESSEYVSDGEDEVVCEPEYNDDYSQSNANDGWTEIQQNPESFIFRENVGVKITNVTVQTLVDLFFTEEFVELLVAQTNFHAGQEIQKRRAIKKPKIWQDVDGVEMKIFMGLLLQMGPCRFPSIDHYWASNSLYNAHFWRSHMSRNRFRLLLRYFHLTGNSVPYADRLHEVRPIIKHFNTIMRENYAPNRNLCIDESRMLWRGKSLFRRCMKHKKHKSGVRLYELYESNGPVMKIKIHSGKSEENDNNLGHTIDIVLHLLEDYLDKGYAVHMDDFYNSVALTQLLNARKTYVCGTLRKNRKGNPEDVVNPNLKEGECIWRQNGHVTVCKWRDRRDVFSISNMHVVEMVEVANRNGKISVKPNIIRDFEKGMSGIDRSHQTLSDYSSLRKSIGWPAKVALHVLETYIHNAHVIFRKTTSSKIKLMQFREEFVVALIGEEIRPCEKRIGLQELHYLESLPPTEKKQRPTRPCRVCTRAKTRRETRYFCPACPDKPPLCVEFCFKTFHEQ